MIMLLILFLQHLLIHSEKELVYFIITKFVQTQNELLVLKSIYIVCGDVHAAQSMLTH